MTAIEAIAAAKAATTEAELDALLVDEIRVSVLLAIKTRRAALTADAGEPATTEGDGMIDVLTTGTPGESKQLYINGVASSFPCGIVLRVTPEAAEQLRQCNLI